MSLNWLPLFRSCVPGRSTEHPLINDNLWIRQGGQVAAILDPGEESVSSVFIIIYLSYFFFLLFK